MSDMRHIKSEIVGDSGREAIFIQRIPQVCGLSNHHKALVFFILTIVTLVLTFLWLPTQNLLENLEKNQQKIAESHSPSNPISAEVNQLKSQLVGLISGSIESKLQVLEESINKGQISITGMNAIQGLKADIQRLNTYAEPIEIKTSTTQQGVIIDRTTTSKVKIKQIGPLLEEISQLKNLVYFTLVSCGLLFAAMGGVWLRGRLRLETSKISLKKLNLRQ